MRKQLLLSTFLIAILNLGYAQSNEISIRFIGNCGLYMTDGSTDIYTDFPYVSGFNQYMEYEDSELTNIKDSSIFIFTHKHPDHYSKKRMKKVLKEKGGSKYGSWDITALENLTTTIPEFKIQAFKTRHFLSKKHYSYLIEWHGKKIFLSGDTEHSELIMSMQNLDWTFMPAWLIREVYMNKKMEVDSKMIVVYHIGLKDNIKIEGEQFMMLNKEGEIITIAY
jgi:L-ascorbate metabolism protein UlaG (beta-lactamase superfamily)